MFKSEDQRHPDLSQCDDIVCTHAGNYHDLQRDELHSTLVGGPGGRNTLLGRRWEGAKERGRGVWNTLI